MTRVLHQIAKFQVAAERPKRRILADTERSIGLQSKVHGIVQQ